MNLHGIFSCYNSVHRIPLIYTVGEAWYRLA